MEKRCPDCHNYMASTEFGKNKRTSDGLANYCRVCTSRRNRRQYLANQERRKTEAREYRASNVDLMREREKERWNRRKDVMAEYRASNRPMINKTRAKWMLARPDYYKVWRLENPERVDYEKAWRAANWDRILELTRVRYEQNPEQFTIAKQAYRARLRNVARVPYDAEQLRQKFAYHGGRCWMCKKLLLPGFHWDHVKPLNKGGPDMISNLRPACGPCNQAKCDRWPFPA